MARGNPGVQKYTWTDEAIRLVEEIASRSQTLDQIAAEFRRLTGFSLNGKGIANAYTRRTGGHLGQLLANPSASISPAVSIGTVPEEGEWDEEPTEVFSREPAQTQPVLPDDTRASSPAPDPDEEMFERLFRLAGRRPTTLEDVCDALELHPAAVRGLVDRATKAGYRIELLGGNVGARPVTTLLEEQVVVAQPGDVRIMALVGDIHFGSKHHMGAQFQDFCDKAHARGVRQFLHVGDLLDGNYRHSVWEQGHRGFEEQVAYAIEHLPRYDGASWHFIQGNHDETLGEHSGLEVGVATVQAFNAAGRSDLHYHGARGAYLRLRAPGEARGMLVELWHPRDKSNAYAKSYRLQKHVEKYAPGQKPDVVAAGHWHQCFFMPIRGVNAFSTGCWQGGQSSFGKSLGGAPDIGSWIVEYSLTPGGTVRTIKPEWVGYHEVETVRDVGLG